jgi:Fe-S-cluster containining protein
LNFTCTQCGNCCSGEPGYVWVTKDEIRRIARFLGREDETLDRSQVRRVGFRYSLTEKPGGDCIFLRRQSGTTSCVIHPVRPLQCRKWPFWTEVLLSPQTWNKAHQKCPGINQGKRYEFAEVEAIRTQSRGKVRSDHR